MARGWESKDVEWQQQRARDEREARERPRQPVSAEERGRLARRRGVELALARARADLERAAQPSHRELLLRTVEALEKELAALA